MRIGDGNAVACTVGGVSAGELFVAPSGRLTDAVADGSRSRPFVSLTQARNAIRAARQAGCDEAWTVRVAAGDYLLSEPFVLLPEDSGREGAPVIYQGEGTATRVMGALRIEGWRVTEEGLWEAPIPYLPDGTRAYFESLYVNGQRAVRARHPNEGFLTPQAVKQTMRTNEQPRVEYAVAELTARGGDLALLAGEPAGAWRYAQVVVHHNWDTTRRMILGFDAASAARRAALEAVESLAYHQLHYVENVRSAFDAPGEWFMTVVRARSSIGEGERCPDVGVVPRFRAIGLQALVAIQGDPPHRLCGMSV